MRKLTTEEFIKRSRFKHGDRFSYDKSIYSVGNKIIVTCSEHGDFGTSPHNHMNGHGCFKCRPKPPRLENTEYLKRAASVHGDKFDYTKTKYIQSNQKITVVCKLHGEFKVFPTDHIKGNGGCIRCMADATRKDTETFINDAIAVHGDKYNYTKVNYVHCETKVTIVCSEHGVFEQPPKAHLKGLGCFKCSVAARRDTLEDFIEKALVVHKNRYAYDKVVYVDSKTPVIIICKDHGEFMQTPNSHLSNSGCYKCNTSKGELKVAEFLTKNNIKYKEQYKIVDSDNNRYRYDFYLTELNVLIEYDGQLHYFAVKFFGGNKTLRATQLRDKAKNELSERHNIPLIRIPYTEYSNLADYLLFKLSKIFKYRDGDNWYKNYLELCTSKQLPPETTVKDVRKYLTYKKPSMLFSEMGY